MIIVHHMFHVDNRSRGQGISEVDPRYANDESIYVASHLALISLRKLVRWKVITKLADDFFVIFGVFIIS